MWKWIGGIVLFLLLVLGGGLWYGFRRLSSFGGADGTTTTVIAASPERVFASLATGDSVPDWMVSGTVRPSRHGALRPGDTLSVTQMDTTVPGAQRMTWVVTEVVPARAITLRLSADTLDIVAITRRFEVQPRADSTVVVVSVQSPMAESVTRARQREGKGGGVLGFTTRLMLGAMRMQSQFEVSQLKARIEGLPAAVIPRPQ